MRYIGDFIIFSLFLDDMSRLIILKYGYSRISFILKLDSKRLFLLLFSNRCEIKEN